jgi:hypothetical protein
MSILNTRETDITVKTLTIKREQYSSEICREGDHLSNVRVVTTVKENGRINRGEEVLRNQVRSSKSRKEWSWIIPV